jgi:hypothetical protein
VRLVHASLRGRHAGVYQRRLLERLRRSDAHALWDVVRRYDERSAALRRLREWLPGTGEQQRDVQRQQLRLRMRSRLSRVHRRVREQRLTSDVRDAMRAVSDARRRDGDVQRGCVRLRLQRGLQRV